MKFAANVAQSAEHSHGKGKVASSILAVGSVKNKKYGEEEKNNHKNAVLGL